LRCGIIRPRMWSRHLLCCEGRQCGLVVNRFRLERFRCESLVSLHNLKLFFLKVVCLSLRLDPHLVLNLGRNFLHHPRHHSRHHSRHHTGHHTGHHPGHHPGHHIRHHSRLLIHAHVWVVIRIGERVAGDGRRVLIHSKLKKIANHFING
jgi:hypothetical protein